MDNKKTYFIELYNLADGSLANKYKFTLDVTTVAELKLQIKDRLISKKEVENHTRISLKDKDDYELGSDDEVDDVVSDGKLKVFRHPDQAALNPTNLVTQVSGTTTQASLSPPVVAVVPVGLPVDYVTKSPVLDLTNFSIPAIDPISKHILKISCPQIRKTPLEISLESSVDTYFELSKTIVKNLGLAENLKAILYNKYGQPYLYNLDLLHSRLPKIDFSQEHTVIFTASPSTID
ncbi:unnamed protein product [Sphagnum balticum]